MLRELNSDGEFIRKNICFSFVGTAIVGAGVLGAGATIYSANKAAQAGQAAANTAANTAMTQFNTVQGNLQPYMQAGAGAQQTLTNMLPTLTAPITMNETTLRNTPGYQFNLTQGLKSVQNSAAARGLGISGAALKGASTFATGLADNTYQNQFQNAVTNQTNAYNRLLGVVQTGESAAAGTGLPASIAGQTAAGAQIAGGNFAAAGANATGTGINNLTNNIAGYAMARGLYGAGNAGVGDPAYGGGNIATDAYGGSSAAPLNGLTAADYGAGY